MIQTEQTTIRLLASATRWAVELRASCAKTLRPPSVAERSRLSERTAVLHMLISCHLSVPENHIGPNLPLNRLGLDSRGLLHLVAAIDLELGVYVSPESLAEGLTIARLMTLVAFGAATRSDEGKVLGDQRNTTSEIAAGRAARHLPELAAAA